MCLWSMRSCLASWVSFERAGGALRPFRDTRPLPQDSGLHPRCWTSVHLLRCSPQRGIQSNLRERPCVAMGCKAAPDALSSRPSIILHNRLWRVLSQPGQWLILRRAGHWHRRQQGRPRLAVISLGRRTRGNLRVWRRRRRTGRAGYWRREPGWRTGSFCQGQASHQQRGEDRVKHQQPPVGNLSTGYA